MPTQVKQPEVSLALVSADLLVGNKPQRILIIGQMITLAQSPSTGGSATPGQLYTEIQNNSSVWDDLFGDWSQLRGMIANARRYNTETRIDVIPLEDNGSGVAASGNLIWSGTATEAGVYTVILGSAADYALDVAVAVGDTAQDVALAVESAIVNDPACRTCPFSVSTPTAGDLPIAAGNAGTVGNSLGMKIEGEVAGLTHSVTAMSGGAVDPSFVGLFDVVEDERYQSVIWPYADDIDTVKDWLDGRFNVDNAILDGVAFVGIDDTFANLQTEGNAQNSQSLVIIGGFLVSETSYKGGEILEIPYAKASQVVGIRALRLTEDASLGRFVISRNATLDRFGGIALASLPYFNTPIPELPLAPIEFGFTSDEVEDLLDAGVAILGNNIANNEVLMGEFVTTYKTDAAANEDVTFTFLNYVDTSSNIREFYFNNYKAQFAQHRLTEGALIPGRAMANPASIEALSTRIYNELAELVLVQAGEAALQFYKENLLVVVDLASGKATVTMKTPIVTQLRQIIGTIQIAFTTES